MVKVLHHVGLDPRDPRWPLLGAALRAGDVAVLLDRAAADPRASAARIAELGLAGVRWCVPEVEHCLEAAPGIEAIADADWWALVAAHEALLEWN